MSTAEILKFINEHDRQEREEQSISTPETSGFRIVRVPTVESIKQEPEQEPEPLNTAKEESIEQEPEQEPTTTIMTVREEVQEPITTIREPSSTEESTLETCSLSEAVKIVEMNLSPPTPPPKHRGCLVM